MIRLVPISEQDLKVWLTAMWVDYRTQLMGAGFTYDEASINIEQNEKALFFDFAPNGDQRIFEVLDNETKVGTLWLATREERSTGEWFVYDIVIDEEFRGKGFGRSAMQAAEEYVKSQGGTVLALNVFGPNAVAKGLYDSLGYRTMNIAMRKGLI
jgi:ribosomal protein S18 acetylase RimI-like enzyme